MRRLPENPNLDHLRAQAKDLLAGLREDRPLATLAEAQAELAGQYGFRTWSDLKAEVDRLRTLSAGRDLRLGAAIAERFGLGTVRSPLTALAAQPAVGRHWSLTTGGGRWSVLEVAERHTDACALIAVRLEEAALAAGVTLPRPVRSPAGLIVERVEERRWRVHESLNTGPPLTTPVTTDVVRSVGSVLAHIHRLELTPTTPVEPWHTARRSEDEWRKLAEDAQRAGAPWAPMLVAALPGLLKLTATPVPASASTPILTHCNFGPGCIARLGSGELVVTGWEHAGALPAEWELAVAIMGWSGHARGRANVRTAQALMGGYLAEGGPVRELGVGAFSSYVCGWLNWTYGQAAMALHVTDREEARVFHRSAADVLAEPLTVDRLESVATAIGEVSRAPGYA